MYGAASMLSDGSGVVSYTLFVVFACSYGCHAVPLACIGCPMVATWLPNVLLGCPRFSYNIYVAVLCVKRCSYDGLLLSGGCHCVASGYARFVL